MAASVPVPQDLTGSVTNQPLPAPGTAFGGGITAGTVYAVSTGQIGQSFNTDYNTISTRPVHDNRNHVAGAQNGPSRFQSYVSRRQR